MVMRADKPPIKRRKNMADIDTVLNSFFSNPAWSATTNASYVYTNDYYQTSTPDAYLIEMPMVGISKDQLSVTIEENRLTVSANPVSKTKFVKSYKQSWILNTDVDVVAISAKLENGLLLLTIPRARPAKKSINVTVS